eukprot:scaffold409711_cov15-Prasinocladus_malaysianus.AAC.1
MPHVYSLPTSRVGGKSDAESWDDHSAAIESINMSGIHRQFAGCIMRKPLVAMAQMAFKTQIR